MAKTDLGELRGPGIPSGGFDKQFLIKENSDQYAMKWNNINSIQEITLGTNWEWDATNGYAQTVAVENIKTPVVAVKTSGTVSNRKAQKNEWAKIVETQISDNIITFIANEPTTTSLNLIIKEI